MKVKYWKGVVVSDEIGHRCEREIAQLEAGEYKSLRLEHLHVSGDTLYSIRVNIKDRLIMTEYNGALIVLEYVENHDYQGSPFVRGRGVGRYIENKLGLNPELIAKSFEPMSDIEQEALNARVNGRTHLTQEVEFHGQHWIELTSLQEESKRARLPALILGPGGSGKSTIALSLLLEEILKKPEDTKPLLYLTEAPLLVDSMFSQWKRMGLDESIWQEKVLFLSIHDVLVRAFNIKREDLVDREHFVQWLTRYPKKIDKALNDGVLWEEFRVCAGCDNEAHYLTLGERQKLIHDVTLRQTIFSLYKKYCMDLASAQKISAPLFKIDGALAPHFYLMIIDEAQNLSPALIRALPQLVENHNIVLFSGEQQSIKSRLNNTYFIHDSYFQYFNRSLSTHHLDKTHRCPKKVARLVSELMKLKRKLVGGVDDKHEQREMMCLDDANEGSVFFLKSNAIDKHLGRLNVENVDFAVITLECFIAEVQLHLPGAVVFTVDNVQGLEFRNLLVYKVLTPEVCLALKSVIDMPDYRHLPQRGQQNFTLKQQMDCLITTMTRTEDCLTIIQDETNPHEHRLVEHLTQFCDPAPDEKPRTVEERAAASSTREEWEAKAYHYWINGHKQQAQQVWQNHLKCTGEYRPGAIAPLSDEGRMIKALTPLAALPKDASQVAVAPAFLTWSKMGVSNMIKDIPLLLKKLSAVELLTYPSPHQGYGNLLEFIFNKESMKRKFLQVMVSKPEYLTALLGAFDEANQKSGLDAIYSLDSNFVIDHARLIPEHLVTAKNICIWLYYQQYALVNALIEQPHLYPVLVGQLSVVNLDDPRTQETSIFYWLTSTVQGRKALTLIIKKDPQLFTKITPQALLHRSIHTGNMSALYWLCFPTNEHALLSKLYRTAPHLVSEITADDLCACRLNPGRPGGSSALFWLTSTARGNEFLRKILFENDGVIERIDGEVFFRDVYLSGEGPHYGSPFYFLTAMQDQCALIDMFFTKNPTLRAAMTIEGLCLSLPAIADKDQYLSPMYWLSVDETGGHLLKKILLSHPCIIEQIDMSFIEFVHRYDNTVSTILQNLEQIEVGREILQLIKEPSSVNKLGIFSPLNRTYSDRQPGQNVDIFEESEVQSCGLVN